VEKPGTREYTRLHFRLSDHPEVLMPRFTTLSALASIAAATFVAPSPAEAHIRLLEPVARYEIEGFDVGIKSCPCGLGGSNRTCNAAVDGSDDNRAGADRVLTAEAGSSLTLRFSEYVGHSGSYRVAFDPDGADLEDFNANILVPMVADPPGNAGNVNEGDVWEIDVTLPDMVCEGCTLQLIQAMHGDMVNPVADPANISSYYACVDLTLVAPGSLPAGDDPTGDDPTGDDPTGGDEGTGAADPLGEVDVPGRDESDDAPADTMGTDADEADLGDEETVSNALEPLPMPNLGNDVRSSGDSGGCAVGWSAVGWSAVGSRTREGGAASLALLGLLGLAWSRRRR
jgi:hypothetical protein